MPVVVPQAGVVHGRHGTRRGADARGSLVVVVWRLQVGDPGHPGRWRWRGWSSTMVVVVVVLLLRDPVVRRVYVDLRVVLVVVVLGMLVVVVVGAGGGIVGPWHRAVHPWRSTVVAVVKVRARVHGSVS